MSKVRVTDLADELKVSAEELLRGLQEHGVQVSTTASTLTEEEVETARAKHAIKKKPDPRNEKRVGTTVIRRRSRRRSSEEEPVAEAAPEPAPAPEEKKATKKATKKAAPEETTPEEKPKKAKKKAKSDMPVFESEEEVMKDAQEKAAKAGAEQAAQVAANLEEQRQKEEDQAAVEAAEAKEKEKEKEEEEQAAKPAPKKHVSEEFMPKTYSIDELIPGYTEMVEDKKREAEIRAKQATQDEADGGKAGKKKGETGVKKDELAAFKEAFGKAKKKNSEYRRGNKHNQDAALRRGIVTENFRARGPRRRKKMKEERSVENVTVQAKASKRVVKVGNSITLTELASQLSLKASDLIRHLMKNGMMLTANAVLDQETTELIADEFGFTIENVAFNKESFLPQIDDASLEQVDRPPVVTIMGHVDHGKTSLLDKIRSEKTNITDGEAGGITQHIGAYVVQTDSGNDIVFVDTPGHEAFTEMRARGAQVTDIVVLVVAADDGVKPQTIEAINHAKAAEVPIVVAVNKMDKAEAKPDRVRQELSDHQIIPEQWGGDTSFVDLSALTGKGIDDLLEILALQAEILELKAPEKRPASGVVIESQLDKGRGPVGTVIIEKGLLERGNIVVAGSAMGRVRTLNNDVGKTIDQAHPGYPAEITGWDVVPDAGEHFHVVADEKSARVIAENAIEIKKAKEASGNKPMVASLDDISNMISSGETQELNVVLKADVQGTVEAIRAAIEKIEHPEVKTNILHSAVGGINESDIQLASISQGLVVGFNVRADTQARDMAETRGVGIRTYSIIYELLDDIKAALYGMLEPTFEEQWLGSATVRDTFRISRVGTVAGLMVDKGSVQRNAIVRLFRDDLQIYEGKLDTLKRFKEDVKEVANGYECRASLENFHDIHVGDVLEVFERVEVAPAAL